MAVLPHYSPGYPGWNIEDQVQLWDLIRRRSPKEFAAAIHVFDTGMLFPKKSLLAIFGITRRLDRVRNRAHLVPCENCSLQPCQYRRSPYRFALQQLEDVTRMQGAAKNGSPSANGHRAPLDHRAKYSLNLRALQKWSEERLQLKTLHDGSVEARFRYEGTTCSNLGQPLEYDYHVIVAAPESGYRILQSTCVPAPGDTGHACQCEYLANAQSLTRAIAGEKPLLGRPLNDVLAWQRAYTPSGCYCDADRRAHKWGLVLEVIHYALVRREQQSRADRQQTATSE
jgi:hypothetical protein